MANIIGYNVYVDGVKYNDNPLRTFRHLVTGLTNGQEYEFAVRAVDEWGNETGDSVVVFETPEGMSPIRLAGRTLVHTYNPGLSNEVVAGTFNSGGSTMYIVEASTPATIHAIDLTFPYDITDDPPIVASAPLGNGSWQSVFNSDGSKLFVKDNGQLTEYALSDNYNIETLSVNEVLDTSYFLGNANQQRSVCFDSHFKRLFLGDENWVRIFDLPAPSSLQGAKEIDTVALPGMSVSSRPWFMTFLNNGQQLFIRDERRVRGCDLSIPFDPHSATLVENIETSFEDRGDAFDAVGSTYFIIGPNVVRQYQL